MITIYKKDKTERFKVGLNEGSIRRYNLMTDDYIKLKFSLIDNEPLITLIYLSTSTKMLYSTRLMTLLSCLLWIETIIPNTTRTQADGTMMCRLMPITSSGTIGY